MPRRIFRLDYTSKISKFVVVHCLKNHVHLKLNDIKNVYLKCTTIKTDRIELEQVENRKQTGGLINQMPTKVGITNRYKLNIQLLRKVKAFPYIKTKCNKRSDFIQDIQLQLTCGESSSEMFIIQSCSKL